MDCPRILTLGRAAIAYAQRFGWTVFPLAAQTKVPAIPKAEGGNGCLDATTDPERINAWWTRYPTANVGIATGRRSGILVLDVDPRNGGDDALAQLEATYGPLPFTVRALTGGGGWHLVFQYDDALDGIPCRPNMLGPGLDVKGNGGYIVAPPSIHPNGNPYAWELSSRPGDVPVAPLPPWLLARLAHPPSRAAESAPPTLDRIAAGSRDVTLTSLAGALRRRGASEAILATALGAINAAHCEPPLDPQAVARIAHSVARYTLTFSDVSGGVARIVKVA